MSQFQLSLLGEPRVKHGEHTLTFSTRKPLRSRRIQMRVNFRPFSCFLTRICCQRNRSNKTSYASCYLKRLRCCPRIPARSCCCATPNN